MANIGPKLISLEEARERQRTQHRKVSETSITSSNSPRHNKLRASFHPPKPAATPVSPLPTLLSLEEAQARTKSRFPNHRGSVDLVEIRNANNMNINSPKRSRKWLGLFSRSKSTNLQEDNGNGPIYRRKQGSHHQSHSIHSIGTPMRSQSEFQLVDIRRSHTEPELLGSSVNELHSRDFSSVSDSAAPLARVDDDIYPRLRHSDGEEESLMSAVVSVTTKYISIEDTRKNNHRRSVTIGEPSDFRRLQDKDLKVIPPKSEPVLSVQATSPITNKMEISSADLVRQSKLVKQQNSLSDASDSTDYLGRSKGKDTSVNNDSQSNTSLHNIGKIFALESSDQQMVLDRKHQRTLNRESVDSEDNVPLKRSRSLSPVEYSKNKNKSHMNAVTLLENEMKTSSSVNEHDEMLDYPTLDSSSKPHTSFTLSFPEYTSQTSVTEPKPSVPPSKSSRSSLINNSDTKFQLVVSPTSLSAEGGSSLLEDKVHSSHLNEDFKSQNISDHKGSLTTVVAPKPHARTTSWGAKTRLLSESTPNVTSGVTKPKHNVTISKSTPVNKLVPPQHGSCIELSTSQPHTVFEKRLSAELNDRSQHRSSIDITSQSHPASVKRSSKEVNEVHQVRESCIDTSTALPQNVSVKRLSKELNVQPQHGSCTDISTSLPQKVSVKCLSKELSERPQHASCINISSQSELNAVHPLHKSSIDVSTSQPQTVSVKRLSKELNEKFSTENVKYGEGDSYKHKYRDDDLNRRYSSHSEDLDSLVGHTEKRIQRGWSDALERTARDSAFEIPARDYNSSFKEEKLHAEPSSLVKSTQERLNPQFIVDNSASKIEKNYIFKQRKSDPINPNIHDANTEVVQTRYARREEDIDTGDSRSRTKSAKGRVPDYQNIDQVTKTSNNNIVRKLENDVSLNDAYAEIEDTIANYKKDAAGGTIYHIEMNDDMRSSNVHTAVDRLPSTPINIARYVNDYRYDSNLDIRTVDGGTNPISIGNYFNGDDNKTDTDRSQKRYTKEIAEKYVNVDVYRDSDQIQGKTSNKTSKSADMVKSNTNTDDEKTRPSVKKRAAVFQGMPGDNKLYTRKHQSSHPNLTKTNTTPSMGTSERTRSSPTLYLKTEFSMGQPPISSRPYRTDKQENIHITKHTNVNNRHSSYVPERSDDYYKHSDMRHKSHTTLPKHNNRVESNNQINKLYQPPTVDRLVTSTYARNKESKPPPKPRPKSENFQEKYINKHDSKEIDSQHMSSRYHPRNLKSRPIYDETSVPNSRPVSEGFSVPKTLKNHASSSVHSLPSPPPPYYASVLQKSKSEKQLAEEVTGKQIGNFPLTLKSGSTKNVKSRPVSMYDRSAYYDNVNNIHYEML